MATCAPREIGRQFVEHAHAERLPPATSPMSSPGGLAARRRHRRDELQATCRRRSRAPIRERWPYPCVRWRRSKLLSSHLLPYHRSADDSVPQGAQSCETARPMIRIGILGAARIAPRGIVTPANALLGAEVVAVAARDPRARAGLRRAALHSHSPSVVMQSSSPATTSTWCTSRCRPRRICEWCTAALASGKHVLVEKPFANNAQDAAQMVAAARAADRHLIEGFHYRFHPLFERALIALCARATSGESATSKRYSTPICPTHRASCATSKRSAAARSWISAATACTGSAPWPATSRRVVAPARVARTPGVDLDIEAELAFTSGPTATLKCSMQPEDGALSAACACTAMTACSSSTIRFAARRRHLVDRIGERIRCRKSSPAATPRSTTSCAMSSKSSKGRAAAADRRR